jgi:ATP-dependent Clp protease ATP-binding subunit ClpB
MKIFKGDVPESMKNKMVVSLDMASVLAGAKFRGEFEDRLKSILKEIEQSGDKIILFIDEIHTIVGAGSSEGAVDASNILKPPLARGELRCLGATTIEEYRKYIEKDAALARRFQAINVEEPAAQDAVSILKGLRAKYEIHHGVKIDDDALESAVQLSTRYMPDRRLPDKAIDVIDEAASRVRMQVESTPAAILAIEEKVADMRRQYDIECASGVEDGGGGGEDKGDATTQPAAEGEVVAPQSQHTAGISNTRNADDNTTSILEERKRLMGQLMDFRSKLGEINDLRVKIEAVKGDIAEAERAGKFYRAHQIEKYELREHERQIDSLYSDIQKSDVPFPTLGYRVGAQEVADVVSKNTGIPTGTIMEGERKNLLDMESALKRKVKGQDAAIASISKCIRVSRAGLRYHDRPLGVFLMIGPTGTGAM